MSQRKCTSCYSKVAVHDVIFGEEKGPNSAALMCTSCFGAYKKAGFKVKSARLIN